MNHLDKIKNLMKTKFALPLIGLCGLILLILIVKLQPNLKHQEASNLAVPVNYINVKSHLIKPEIIGFGVIKPDIKLQAKAEVSGRVTYIHPELKKGEMFFKDTLLLTIDDKDYLLQLKQAQADLLANKANLQEMKLTIDNNELELVLALEKLAVRNTEYKRMFKLSKTGVISQSTLNAEKQNQLRQKQEVQQLENRKTTLPSTLEVMKAQLAISEAKLEKSKRDLERTQIKMPFDGRISQVYTELDQYVTAGGLSTAGQLFDAFSLNKMIINAQFPLDQFRTFAQNFNQQIFSDENNPANMGQVLESLGLTAIVEDPSGLFKPWLAKVERFSDDLDAKSRTVGVMVSILDSYKEILPGSRPPLLEGMYMKIRLWGKAKNMLSIPRFAMHNKQVYIINNEDKLQRLTLENVQYNGDLVLIEQALKTNDKIITSDVFPAVDNMSVMPILDENLTRQMNIWLDSRSEIISETGANQ